MSMCTLPAVYPDLIYNQEANEGVQVQASTLRLDNYTSLFLDEEQDHHHVFQEVKRSRELDEYASGDDEEYDEDEDDDSETIVWLTPRPRPRVQDLGLGLEEPDDDFQLDAPASPSDEDSDSSSSSSSSDSDSSSKEDFWSEDEEAPSSPDTSITSLDRPANERELTEPQIEEEEDDESWLDEEEGDSSSDGSDVSDDDEEGETLLDALLTHEEKLGGTFVYFDEAIHANNFESTRSLEDIVFGVRKTSDTYVAAMRIFLRVIDAHDGGALDELTSTCEEIQHLAHRAAHEWLEDFPEESRALGRARFALIGQLTRLKIFSPTIVFDMINELDGQLHLEGRMHGLQALVRYAGPRVHNEWTYRALERVEDACNERPGDYMMHWLYSKIKRDMLVYRFRDHFLGDYPGRVERLELVYLVTSQAKKQSLTLDAHW